MEVVVDGLRLRHGMPGLSGFDSILSILSAGDTLFVFDSPLAYTAPGFSPDGRGWYTAAIWSRVDHSLPQMSGWVAEGDSRLEFLATLPALCPASDPDLSGLLRVQVSSEEQQLSPWDRLACLGATELHLEGMLDWSCVEGPLYPFTLEPAWLIYDCPLGIFEADPEARPFQELGIPLHFDPAISYPAYGRGDLVRVRGHFDGDTAADCHLATPGDWPVDPEFLTLLCREHFVVDEIEVTGHYDLPEL